VDNAAVLTARVALLDAGPGDPAAALSHVAAVMARVTAPGVPPGPREVAAAAISPALADEIAARSHLLRSLEQHVPELVSGPLCLDRQHWIATQKPSFLGQRLAWTPGEAHFTAPAPAATAKPFFTGLFTSTAAPGPHGMWRTYLDLHPGSTLFPLPWVTWLLHPRPSVRVFEIRDAGDWARLAATYPKPAGSLIYPDWLAVSQDWDGVHMMLRAIAATQGQFLRTQPGIIAAPYWDVESTLWLRWRFDSASLVGVDGRDLLPYPLA
jgi:hypothetical protein